MTTTTFHLFNAAGNEVVTEPSKFDHYARYSMRCAAEQKRLAALALEHSTATTAEIRNRRGGAVLFKIDGRRYPQHAGFRSSETEGDQ